MAYLSSTLRSGTVFSVAAQNDGALFSECLLYVLVIHCCDHISDYKEITSPQMHVSSHDCRITTTHTVVVVTVWT